MVVQLSYLLFNKLMPIIFNLALGLPAGALHFVPVAQFLAVQLEYLGGLERFAQVLEPLPIDSVQTLGYIMVYLRLR